MAFKFLTIPMHDPQSAESELNAFLRSHRVLSIDRQWIESGLNSCWMICVDYLESSGVAGGGGVASGNQRASGSRERIDYREVLNPADFAVFARLRDWRRGAAQGEGVPIYAVFTNAQLARMVQDRATTRADLEKIAGVGDARIDKYGPGVLDLLKPAGNGTNAPSGEPV